MVASQQKEKPKDVGHFQSRNVVKYDASGEKGMRVFLQSPGSQWVKIQSTHGQLLLFNTCHVIREVHNNFIWRTKFDKC